MRCKACDTLLNDRETTKKDYRGTHLDLCTECAKVSRQEIVAVQTDPNMVKDNLLFSNRNKKE